MRVNINSNDNEDQNDCSERYRSCLMCGDRFLSFGPGNRICKKCKSTQAWRQG